MRTFVRSLLLLATLFAAFLGAARFEIDGSAKAEVHRKFFGVNSLYWIENDATRDDPRLIKALKEAKVSLVRYPGGEVADNFNWKTNTLFDPHSFPYSKGAKDARARMDFDEFMAWIRKFGAEPVIVVNLEEGFVEGDLEKAANLAAEWVRYANIEKGYGVKYWEIGNESYHLGTRYALRSKEYAAALRLFSKKMKAVDPTIKIGANGPWDYRATPIIDTLPESQVRYLRSLKTTKEKKRFRKRFKQTFVYSKKYPSWWEVVAGEAADAFDFAAIHQYTGHRKSDRDLLKPMRCERAVRDLRRFLREVSGKEYAIALTEYNVAAKSGERLSASALSLTLAEMMANYLNAGVELANYWPMRLKSKRALFTLKNSKRPPYYVFKAYSTLTDKYVLNVRGRDRFVYAFATGDEARSQITLFLINRTDAPQKAQVRLPGRYIIAESYRIDKTDLRLKKLQGCCCTDEPQGIWSFELDPLSLTIYKFNLIKHNQNLNL